MHNESAPPRRRGGSVAEQSSSVVMTKIRSASVSVQINTDISEKEEDPQNCLSPSRPSGTTPHFVLGRDNDRNGELWFLQSPNKLKKTEGTHNVNKVSFNIPYLSLRPFLSNLLLRLK
jgi:hypothetical protein